MQKIVASCLALVLLFNAWANAEPKQADIVVTVQSLEGDDIKGVLRVDEMKASIANSVRDGNVVFRGGLLPATEFLLERGARPLDTKVRGRIEIPGNDPEESTFAWIFQDHVILHTDKWTVEVIGPKDFAPKAARQ